MRRNSKRNATADGRIFAAVGIHKVSPIDVDVLPRERVLSKPRIEAYQNLNQVYQKLDAKLNAGGKALLRRHQLEWVRERNAACSRTDASGFLVNLKCATAKTNLRTKILEDRYSECVSIGCQTNRL